MMDSRLRRKQTGLSLLELLVTLVLISLVSTVIVQGFGFGLSLYDRVTSRSNQTSTELLINHWIRFSVSALVAGKVVETSLSGAPDGFSAVTLNPLLAPEGTPTRISWRLEGNTLEYLENEKVLEVRELESLAAFEYRNTSGEWVGAWMPTDDALDLPRAIRLRQDKEILVTAAVRTRLDPDLLLEESRRER